MKRTRTALSISAALFGLAFIATAPAAADQVILDDLIVDGSICAGLDCVNGESFGFDTLRLKENNLRIKAQDTSTSASFPSNDWQITFNESSNGGQNKFSIDDIDGGRTPFTIEAGAPSHSLYVDDGGRIGLGTSTPVVEVHIVDGDTPTLRLEQDGSSGFTPQTWDVAGNETNFFVRDATNGSKLPFRIRPNSPSNSIFVKEGDGDVGFGTSAPNQDLHVSRANATSFIKLEQTGGTAANVGFVLTNTGGGVGDWNVFKSGTTGDLTISSPTPPNIELLIDGITGNVTIGNDLTVDGTIFGTVASSRKLKEAIEPVNTRDVLAKVARLPMAEWNYSIGTVADNERHMGPMAEDFYAAFGLGRDEASISLVDYSGVAFAAIQGLNEVVEEKDRAIRALEERLAQLEAALGLTANE